MKKYDILVRKGKEHSTEGYRLKKLVNNCFMDDFVKQEEMVSKMRADINNERYQRWRHWVDNSRARPLIVIPGGNAQMADRLKEAEKTWG
eukprot:9152135-Heterocapsa_arctica.AAC.1